MVYHLSVDLSQLGECAAIRQIEKGTEVVTMFILKFSFLDEFKTAVERKKTSAKHNNQIKSDFGKIKLLNITFCAVGEVKKLQYMQGEKLKQQKIEWITIDMVE